MAASPALITALPTGSPAQKQHFSIVVAGEFNAGKSSIINLLLQKEVVPTEVSVSDLPPAVITPSDREHYEIQAASKNGEFHKADFLNGKITSGVVTSIEISTPLPQFNGASITEVSVNQDGTLAEDRKAIIENADLLIWCTMGQRAWCLSEISIIKALPKPVLDNAILAVTRSDYLKNTDNLSKVKNRLAREADEYFDEIIMLDCSNSAITAASNEGKWAKSGGKALFDSVQEIFRHSPFYGKAPTEVSEAPGAIASPPPAYTLTEKEALAAWNDTLNELSSGLETTHPLREADFARRVQCAMVEFVELVIPATTKTSNTSKIKMAFDEAIICIEHNLAQDSRIGIALLSTALSLQLEREFFG